ncbi:MAG TPA: hypothetical protein ENH98_04485 [archaeon]|nr:hypothetical protein [archaeon]
MHSSQFQTLIKVLQDGYISEFINLVDKFTENKPFCLTDSINYNKFKNLLERSYYDTLSDALYKGRFDKFSQLFNYSDKLGIFIDASNIDVTGIITKLHIEGLNNGNRGRIVELVSFFNKYNLFERNFTSEELKIIQEIKENYQLLVINLKDLFGNVSDSLIYYVCKMMPHDYVVWLSENYSMLGEYYNEDYPARVFVTNPNFLRNWTDNFSQISCIY